MSEGITNGQNEKYDDAQIQSEMQELGQRVAELENRKFFRHTVEINTDLASVERISVEFITQSSNTITYNEVASLLLSMGANSDSTGYFYGARYSIHPYSTSGGVIWAENASSVIYIKNGGQTQFGTIFANTNSVVLSASKVTDNVVEVTS